MVDGGGSRLRWAELPADIRSAVERMLGAPVRSAESQPGGFSPGSADRLVLADGRRAFVKVASTERNEESVRLHRREAAISAGLPAGLPVPRLLGIVDESGWIALAFADVDGRPPREPWIDTEIDAALRAVTAIGAVRAMTGLPLLQQELAVDFGGWQRLRVEPAADLPPTAANHLPELIQLAAMGLGGCAGDRLVHLDVRADNLLVRPDGSVVVVDWPWACAGAPWVDPLMLLANVALHGGDVSGRLAELAACQRVSEHLLEAFLAGLAGFMLDAARRPAPLALPRLRGFQRRQGDAWLSLLAARRGWSPG